MDANLREPEVRAAMTPAKAIDGDIFDAYVAYLRHSQTYVEKVYQLEKAGGFVGAGSAGVARVYRRAAGGRRQYAARHDLYRVA